MCLNMEYWVMCRVLRLALITLCVRCFATADRLSASGVCREVRRSRFMVRADVADYVMSRSASYVTRKRHRLCVLCRVGMSQGLRKCCITYFHKVDEVFSGRCLVFYEVILVSLWYRLKNSWTGL